MQALRRTFRPAFVAGCLCALWILTACSAAPESIAPTDGASPMPNGGIETTPETSSVDHPTAPIPTADAQGVYPPPESADSSGTTFPKAVTPGLGTNAVYLPAIINQKPPLYPFEVQPTGVLAIQGFFGCQWIGVAGQVFNQAEAPIQNLILLLEGFWDGNAVSSEALSGSAAQYGPAGYEFVLGTQPLDSTQTLWIQVRDASRKEISARIYLNTYNDCARNLILVNFLQVR
jgi:hypothetical protein